MPAGAGTTKNMKIAWQICKRTVRGEPVEPWTVRARPAWPPRPPTLQPVYGRTYGRLRVSGLYKLSILAPIFLGATSDGLAVSKRI